MIARIVELWLGMGVDIIRVRFDELYKLCTGAAVNARCDLGALAGGGYSLDLLGRYVGDNRPQATIFDFRFERVTDGGDPNILVEGSSGHFYPSDPVSMRLDLVEVKVVAKPDFRVDEPSKLVPLRQSPSRRIGNDGIVSKEGHRPIEVGSALRFHQGADKRPRVVLSAPRNADAVRRQQSQHEPHRTRPHGRNLCDPVMPIRCGRQAVMIRCEGPTVAVTNNELRGAMSLSSDAHHRAVGC
jgi:hypothetical protein